MTPTIEDEVAVIFDQHHADKRDVPAIAQYVHRQIENQSRRDMAGPLVFIVDQLRSTTAAGFWVDCLSIATQIDRRPGCRLTHIARAYCAPAVIAERVNFWLEKLSLPRPSHLKTEQTTLEYIVSLRLGRWRRGHSQSKESQDSQ